MLVVLADVGVLIDVLGAGIGLVALVVSVYLHFRRPKIMNYVVVTSQRFAVTTLHKPQRLQVVYDGEAVNDVHLVGVVLTNIGTSDIEPDDFIDGSLRLELHDATDTARRGVQPRSNEGNGRSGKIVGADVVSEPARWEKFVTVEEGAVNIGPCYFERVGFGGRKPLALQLVLINYHRQDLRIEQHLRNGVIHGRDIGEESARRWVIMGAAVAGLLAGAIVGPRFPSTASGSLREPYNSIFGVYDGLFLLAGLGTGVWHWLSVVRYRRQQGLFK